MGITRKFLGFDQPALFAATDFLLGRSEEKGVADLRDTVVVMPGRRAGRRLLEILVEQAEQKSLILTPPVIETVGRLPEQLYAPQRPFASDLTQRLAWCRSLQATPQETVSHVIPFPPHQDDSVAWMNLADLIRRQHTELAADGLDFGDVAERGMALEGFSEQSRWQALRTIQETYLAKLDELGLWDIQTARLVAIQRRECAFRGEIVLLGTVDMNVALRRMIDQVADQVNALVFAPRDWAHRFDSHGCLLEDEWQDIDIPLDMDHVHVADDVSDQADEVVRSIARFDGRYSADQITIGVSDELVVPRIERTLTECGVPARWGPGKSLAESGPVRLLRSVSAFARSNRYDEFAALARHPDVASWFTRSGVRPDWLSQLDEYYSCHLQYRLGSQWLGTKSRYQLVRRAFELIQQLIEPLHDGRRPLGDWVEPIQDVMRAVYEARTLDRNQPADLTTLTACEKIRDVLLDFAKVPLSLAAQVSAPDAINWALEAVESNNVPPMADEAAIELLGWLELPLDDAPVLVVCGFNDGVVPESLNSDLFLPDLLRRQLGLMDNRRRYARDAYATSVLVGARQQVEWIVGRRNADNDPLAPSRLLFATHGEEVARRALRLFSPPTAKKRAISGGLNSSREVSEFPISEFPIPRPKPLEEPILGLSVTGFRSYIACPYRFYLKHVLHLKSLDDSSEELDGAEFGTLLHEVLSRFGSSPCRDSTVPEEIQEVLFEELAKCRQRQYGKYPRAAVDVQIEQLRTRLRAFAHRQAAWAAEGWRVEYTEVPSQDHQDASFEVDDEPFVLRGRIDRIDVHCETGERVILDYKSSDIAKTPEQTHKKRGQWVDLQLPLYRHLATVLDISQSACRLGYVNLPRDPRATDFYLAKWTTEELDAADIQAHDVIRRIRNQEFWPPADPPPDYSEEFAAICQDKVFEKARS